MVVRMHNRDYKDIGTVDFTGGKINIYPRGGGTITVDINEIDEINDEDL
jgi:coenzyme F420-reducing hydrogenase beta subunit